MLYNNEKWKKSRIFGQLYNHRVYIGRLDVNGQRTPSHVQKYLRYLILYTAYTYYCIIYGFYYFRIRPAAAAAAVIGAEATTTETVGFLLFAIISSPHSTGICLYINIILHYIMVENNNVFSLQVDLSPEPLPVKHRQTPNKSTMH